MARKFKHGRMVSHKKNRILTANASGKKNGTWKNPFWEVHCDIHGIKRGKDIHLSRKVSAPATKSERFGGGCPDCI